ncbi:MAG: hypothetical protein IM638_03125 [Bacteroidetes bacterium]|nr:hypothetical protein [Bacteroidota bacterium]
MISTLRHIGCALALFLLTQTLQGQCTGGTNAGALSPAPAAAFQTMNVSTGNYYTFVVPATCFPTYTFSFCAADGSNATFDSQITILDNAGNPVPGGYSDDFCGVQSYVTWTPTAGGTYRVLVNTYFCSTGNTALLAYRAVAPANMVYSSSTTVQASTASVMRCDFDQPVISLNVITTGSCNALSLNQLSINMTGSTIPGTNTNDVTRIRIYYTGTSATFQNISEFQTGGATPATGTITFNGSQTLQAGTNYFWIAYDLNASTATIANVIDAQCVSFRIGTTTYTPAVTAPAGNRAIAACSSYPGASSANLRCWLRANTGVTSSAGAVTQWNDQSGAGVTGNFIVQPGTPAQTSPTLVNNALNNNPYISFNGTTNSLASNNLFTGNSLFSTNNNTVFQVHNLKAGIVYFKWETASSGSFRFGYENNAGSPRFDFVDDVAGRNTNTTTNVLNRDVLVRTTTTAALSEVVLNSNVSGSLTLSGLNFSPGTTTRRLCIGNNDISTNNLPTQIDFAEILVYNTLLNSSEIRRVESYLAVKYGITLKNNQGSGAPYVYQNSAGTSIWGGNTSQIGYHNNVTGIGRDDASTLNQTTSRGVLSLNPSVDLVTITTGTFAAPAAFSANLSTLIIGHNAGAPVSIVGDPSFSNVPASLGTNAARIQRVWQAQATNFTQTVSVGFESTLLVAYTPITNLRLLVDNDGNFANGGTTIYTGAVLSGTRIQFSGITNLGNTGNLYFTLATVNYTATPLPVELLSFTSACVDNVVELRWSTASESENNHFTIKRKTASGNVFETIATISGSGNSMQPVNYSWFDNAPLTEDCYYILEQTDFNGQTTRLSLIYREACVTGGSNVVLFPSPASEVLGIGFTLDEDAPVYVDMFDATGRKVRSTLNFSGMEGRNFVEMNIHDLAPGVYMLQLVVNNVPLQTQCVVKQ